MAKWMGLEWQESSMKFLERFGVTRDEESTESPVTTTGVVPDTTTSQEKSTDQHIEEKTKMVEVTQEPIPEAKSEQADGKTNAPTKEISGLQQAEKARLSEARKEYNEGISEAKEAYNKDTGEAKEAYADSISEAKAAEEVRLNGDNEPGQTSVVQDDLSPTPLGQAQEEARSAMQEKMEDVKSQAAEARKDAKSQAAEARENAKSQAAEARGNVENKVGQLKSPDIGAPPKLSP